MFGMTGPREIAFLFFVLLIYVAAIALPAALICRRIGHSPLLGILTLIPGVNIAFLWYVAVSRWPAEREAGTM